MTYIYDILVNWNNNNTLYEFYEWEQNDNLEHIKRIPLFKVEQSIFKDFLTSEVKIEEEFLLKIKKQTELYKKKYLPYASLFTDGTKVIAVLFDEMGNAVLKSHLLLDEEEDILLLSKKQKAITISYEKGKEYLQNSFITRNDQLIRIFLKREFLSCYNLNNREKLKYIYDEYFDEKEDDVKVMYDKLCNSLEEITEKHKNIYELLKLSYTKTK